MALQPTRRAFSQEKKSGLRDVDAADRAQKLKAFGFALYGGIPLGIVVGILVDQLVLCALLGPVLVYSVVMAVATLSGRGASLLYMPSGSSTPKRREYSRAKALEIRGEYEESIRAYEVEILNAPEIGEPYLKVARLFRDELKDLDSAVRWFRRAQSEACLLPGEAIRTHREISEIFLHTLREPRRAAPDLARLAEAFPDTPDGKWAAKELAAIKDEMSRESPEPEGEF